MRFIPDFFICKQNIYQFIIIQSSPVDYKTRLLAHESYFLHNPPLLFLKVGFIYFERILHIGRHYHRVPVEKYTYRNFCRRNRGFPSLFSASATSRIIRPKILGHFQSLTCLYSPARFLTLNIFCFFN